VGEAKESQVWGKTENVSLLCLQRVPAMAHASISHPRKEILLRARITFSSDVIHILRETNTTLRKFINISSKSFFIIIVLMKSW
jgi:hypothetical protein